MEWRVTIELSGADGTMQTREVARGGYTDPHSTLDPLGLTLNAAHFAWQHDHPHVWDGLMRPSGGRAVARCRRTCRGSK
jgi:hypothetical protein